MTTDPPAPLATLSINKKTTAPEGGRFIGCSKGWELFESRLLRRSWWREDGLNPEIVGGLVVSSLNQNLFCALSEY